MSKFLLRRGRNFDIAKTVVGSHNAFSHVETDIQIYIFLFYYHISQYCTQNKLLESSSTRYWILASHRVWDAKTGAVSLISNFIYGGNMTGIVNDTSSDLPSFDPSVEMSRSRLRSSLSMTALMGLCPCWFLLTNDKCFNKPFLTNLRGEEEDYRKSSSLQRQVRQDISVCSSVPRFLLCKV